MAMINAQIILLTPSASEQQIFRNGTQQIFRNHHAVHVAPLKPWTSLSADALRTCGVAPHHVC